jgi:hypothetical protein
MKRFAFIFVSAFLAMTTAAGAQSTMPDDPDSLFGPAATSEPTAGVPAPAAAPAPAPAPASAPVPAAKGVEVGGALFSDYTGFLRWTDSYPNLAEPSAGASSQFVPNLEADLYFDARPIEALRVFTKLKAVYPFAAPGVSVFEVYADLTWRDLVYFRAGQQVVNWGVGYFFSPADIISLTAIDPLRPDLERAGPLALKINVPFADVDNLYLYFVASQAFTSNGEFRLDDIAVAPKVEFLMGAWEIGVGAYYQKNQRPKAMITATGSVFGQLGLFAEGVLSRGVDRVLVQETSGAPGAFLTSADTTTPTFSGTIGARYLQADWHVSVSAQYYYNGPGYADAAGERAAIAAYGLQLQGTPPAGPQLSPSDIFQPGRHYCAGLVSWTDILGSKVDLALFYEGNLSDGSGVTSPSIAFTPFRYLTMTFAPYITYGGDGTEFVSMFGRLSLSMKLTLGTGSF